MDTDPYSSQLFYSKYVSFTLLSTVYLSAVEYDSDDSGPEPSPSPEHTRSYPTPNPSTSATQPQTHRPLNGDQNSHTRRKRPTREIQKQDSSSEDNSSDFEASPRPLDMDSESDEGDEKLPRLKAQILDFFQKATVDELTLIAGCSLKKAQKIIELRPYQTWSDLVSGSAFLLLLLHIFLSASIISSSTRTINRSQPHV